MATGSITKVSNDSASGYCKMPDGTLIQWGTVTFSNVAAGATDNKDVALPIPFISVPFGVANVNSTVAPHLFECNVRPYGTIFTTTRIYARNGSQSAQTIDVAWLCIGRWK